jgi:arginase
MRPTTLLTVPYHFGLRDIAVGAGPTRLLAAGADRILSYRGVPAAVHHIDLRDKSCEGLDAVVDWNRQIRIAVREAREQERLAVILAGNCISCLGTLGGLGGYGTGVVWLDAHADFNTPESSISGNVDGMALAAALGHCHEDLRGRIGVDMPVEAGNTLLLEPRDLDPAEVERLAEIPIRRIRLGEVPTMPPGVEQVYLHLDLDFLSCEDSPGVACHLAGGVPLDQACTFLADICRTLPVAAVGITNYRPDLDENDKTLTAALKLLESLG